MPRVESTLVRRQSRTRGEENPRGGIVVTYSVMVRVTVYSPDGSRKVVRERSGGHRGFGPTVGQAVEDCITDRYGTPFVRLHVVGSTIANCYSVGPAFVRGERGLESAILRPRPTSRGGSGYLGTAASTRSRRRFDPVEDPLDLVDVADDHVELDVDAA